MRRHLQAESASVTLYLSREEEAILNDDQNVIVDTIAQQNVEVDRVLEVCENVQFAQGVVAEVTDLSPVEGELLAAVGDMAVAGTDADPGDLMDTVADGALVTTEGFAEGAIKRLLEIWAKVKELLVSAYKGLMEFFTGRDKALANAAQVQVANDKFVEDNKPKILLLGHDPSLDGEAKEAANKAAYEKNMAALKEKLEHYTFQFKGPVAMISTISGVPKDFEKQFQDTIHYAETTHKDIGRSLRAICYGFDKAISNFNTDKPETGLLPFVDEFHKTLGALMNSIGNKKDSGELSSGVTKIAAVGGFSIQITDKASDGAGSLANALKNCASATFEIKFGTGKGEQAPLFPAVASQPFSATINKWLNYAKSNDASGLEKELNEYGQKFVAHIDKVLAAQQSVKGQVAAEGAEDPFQLMQATISLCHAINKLVVEFTSKHMKGTLAIVRAAQQYQEQSNHERVKLFDEAMKSA